MLEKMAVPRRALDFGDYIDILRRNILWIIGPAFLSIVVITVIVYNMQDTYVSTALIRVEPQSVPEEYIHNAVNQSLADRINSMAESIESHTTLGTIINSYGLYKNDLKREPLDDVIATMQHAIQINVIGNIANTAHATPAFQLSFSYSDRHLAQKVCQELVTRFINASVRERSEQAIGTQQLLDDEFEKAKRDLDALEQQVTVFRMKNAGHLPEQMEANVQQLNALQQRLQFLNEAQSRVSQERMMLDSSLSIARDRLASLKDLTAETRARNERLDQLDKEISTAESNINAMRQRVTEAHPDLEAAKLQLAQLKAQQEELAKAEKAKAPDVKPVGPNREKLDSQAQIEQIQTMIKAKDLETQELVKETAAATAAMKSYQSRIEEVPLGEREFQDLVRDRELAKNRYNELEVKRSQAQMASEMEQRKQSETLETIDAASLPETPTEPRRQVIVPAGFAAGIGLGILLVAVREIKDTSLRNLKDARLYTQLPILGSVPLLENDLVVQRRKQMTWIGWAAATLGGLAVIAGSIAHYYMSRV
jgi:polysaccharide chain length determinant protein (PEP-CTERM system associated)